MAQTKRQIQSLLAEAGATPRHRLGQYFMIDANLVRCVADAGMIRPGDLVIEIGPGTGTLTEELVCCGAEVLAVEIDRALADLLRSRFGSNDHFSLIEGDALAGKHALDERISRQIQEAKSAGKTVRLVANLPYNVASPLVLETLMAGVDLLAFTVQKEVADRLRAKANSSQYGTLSVMTQLLSRVEILRTLPPSAFWPMPKVESALVRLTRVDHLGNEAKQFGEFLQKIFSARRKTLHNAMSKISADGDKCLEAAGVNGQLRPQAISPGDFLKLFRGQK